MPVSPPPASAYIFRITTLLVGIAILCAANGLQNIVLPLQSEINGFTRTVTGIIMGSYFAGVMVSAFIIPGLIRSAGYVRTFAALTSLCSSAALAYIIFPYAISWIFVRFTIGFLMAGVFVVSETWVNEISEERNRGTILSAYMGTVYLGLASGQFLLLASPADKMVLFFLTSILISISTVPMLLIAKFDPPPPPQIKSRFSIETLWKSSPLGFIATPFLGAMYATFFTMMPVAGYLMGLSPATISTGMGLLISFGAVSIVIVGRISDKLDRRYVIIACSFISGLCFLIFYYISLSNLTFLILMAISGSVVLPIYPILLAHIGDRTKENRVSSVATTILLNGIGAMIGPAVAGLILDKANPSAIFLFLLGLAIIVMIFSLARKILDWSVDGKRLFKEHRQTLSTNPIVKTFIFNRFPLRIRNKKS